MIALASPSRFIELYSVLFRDFAPTQKIRASDLEFSGRQTYYGRIFIPAILVLLQLRYAGTFLSLLGDVLDQNVSTVLQIVVLLLEVGGTCEIFLV